MEETEVDPRRERRRRRLVNALAVLACIGTLVSVLAVWSHRLLLDTDTWVETVGPLAEDPAVIDAVSTAVTNEIFQLVKPEDLAKKALPDKADFLAAPLSNALYGFVDKQTTNLLETDQFQQFWTQANRVVHQNAVALLRGETVRGFTATNGTVTLNIMPLLSKTLIWILDHAPGSLGENIQVPVITQDTPPDQARQELGAAFHVTLPPTFGVYTIFQSDQLAAAQSLVTLFDRLVYVIVIVTLALLIAAIALSHQRRRTLIGLGAGVVLAMVLADVTMGALRNVILDLIGSEENRAAARATIDSLIDGLRVVTNVLLVVGAVLVVVAFITGDSRLARGIRDGVGLATGRLPRSSSSISSTALPAITQHAGLLKVVGLLAAAGVLLIMTPTVRGVVVVLLVLGLYELVLGIVTHRPDGTADDVPDDAAPAAT